MKLNDVQSLYIEITSHCNIKCPQCSRTDEDGNLASYVDLEHWNADVILNNLNIDKLINLQFVRIEGDNGDALMHPEFERILDAFYYAPTKPKILILTNGSMRSAAWWEQLGKNHQERLTVQFSIDGLEDTHKLYRVGADYKKTINNAKAFIRGGGNATQRCLVFKHNEHQLEKINQVAKDVGFTALQIASADVGRFQGRRVWPVFFKNQQTHIIEPPTPATYSLYEYGNYRENLKFIPRTHNIGLICPTANLGEVYVTYKGHLIPCCMYHADLYFDHPNNDAYRAIVGDINTIDVNQRSLEEIFSDEEYYEKRFEEMLRSSPLERCQQRCGNYLKNIRHNGSVANVGLRATLIKS